jgi:hypothetical protein
MNKVKIIKTSTRELSKIEDKINFWAKEENVVILQLNTVLGESYSVFGQRTEDREVFIIILYSGEVEKI